MKIPTQKSALNKSIYLRIRPFLVVLGKDGPENRVDHPEDNRVGQSLDKQRLAGRQGEDDTGSQKDKQKHGNNHVGVNHLFSGNFFLRPRPYS